MDRDQPVVVPVIAEGEGDEELTAGPRLPRWLVLSAIGVIAAGGLTALALKSVQHHAAAPPTASPSPSVTSPAPQGVAGLSVQDFALDRGGELYVLTSPPEQLVAVDRNGSIRARAPAPVGAHLVVANPTSDLVWVIVPEPGISDVFVYAGGAMTGIGRFRVPAAVVAADAIDNQLWMATNHGIYRGPMGERAIRVPGYTGPMQLIAADPSRFRLLAVSKSHELITVDRHAARAVRRLTTVRPLSIAVTDGGIWLVGIGQPFGSRLGRLDPRTLRVTLVGGPDAQAQRGASGWSGRSVLWIKYADSGSVVCLDGRTGEPSGAFPETDTPVASVPGVVYAVRGRGVVRLPSTPACSG
jgi:hypothetical protein